MTDQYMEQQGSKKKYLIPLVVLMLCAVSLTGAGYAYNSSVTVDSGNIDVASFELEIGDKNVIDTTDKVIEFNSVVKNLKDGTKNTVYTVDSEHTSTITVKVKINANNQKFASADLKSISAKVMKSSDDSEETNLTATITGLAAGDEVTTTGTDITITITGSLTFTNFADKPEATYYIQLSAETEEATVA